MGAARRRGSCARHWLNEGATGGRDGRCRKGRGATEPRMRLGSALGVGALRGGFDVVGRGLLAGAPSPVVALVVATWPTCRAGVSGKVGVAGPTVVVAVRGRGHACCTDGEAADDYCRCDRIAESPAHVAVPSSMTVHGVRGGYWVRIGHLETVLHSGMREPRFPGSLSGHGVEGGGRIAADAAC